MAEVLMSTVRVPTPEPDPSEPYEHASPPPLKRRRVSDSPEPPPRRPPPPSPPRRREPPPAPLTEEEKKAAAKKEFDKLLESRSGGTYVPPARLRALQASFTDPATKEFQRMAWEALKKSINGLVNKVNVANIKPIIPELFHENLLRGQGLFCRSIMKAQAASLPFTPIYAAMAAIVNTKIAPVGELLVKRLVMQFRKAFKRNDKAVCLSSTTFIAHLVNQHVVNEMLAAQILLLLLRVPTDDSVEIAVGLTREVGQHMEERSKKISQALFDQFRNVLHEEAIDKRTQYMIEVLFQVRRDKYKDNPAIKEELDLVEEDDWIEHEVDLDDENIDTQDGLNIFKFDPNYQEHEDEYKKVRIEILGNESDEGAGRTDDDSDDSEADSEEEEQERQLEIRDQTNADLVSLRRTIYLTIKSSGGFEEAVHKLMKINLPRGQEKELVSMIIEGASQERTYNKFYGMIGERFCKLNRMWMELYEEAFEEYFSTIHRYESSRLRIIAQFFGHLLATDAIGWYALSVVRLSEDETTSSSRIFIKILFEELAAAMGMDKLVKKMRDETLQEAYVGLFPRPEEDQQATRFAINFFTAIGMGRLTDDMRARLKALA